MRCSKSDIEGLTQLACELLHNKSIVVELGSYSGDSATIFAPCAKMVFCIDPWLDIEEIGATADGSTFKYENMKAVEAKFDENTSKFDNIVKIRGNSDDVVKIIDNRSIDFVYIDSLHHYPQVRRDIDKWYPKVKVGGWIGGHNYGDYWPGVIRAVNESFNKPDKLFIDTSWIVRKLKRKLQVK